MRSVRSAPEGWAARTDRPLGSIPIIFAALVAIVIANAFTSIVSAVAWVALAACALVLLTRAVRWLARELEAAQFEPVTAELLSRQQSRLVPHPRATGRSRHHVDDASTFHKAS